MPYGAEPLREEVLPQRNVPGRCCREGNQFGKPGPGGPMERNQQDLLLVLPELASRLTVGNAYLRKAQGQLCASASVPRGPSVREKYSWQWEDSRVPPSGGISWAQVHRDRSLHRGNARLPPGHSAVEGSEDGGGGRAASGRERGHPRLHQLLSVQPEIKTRCVGQVKTE